MIKIGIYIINENNVYILACRDHFI
ncbi:hypothetical protein CNEO3_750010 [Clostridium neonatale]|nr:hypothetical protein CNEO3_750010 [Clostridium neonatale]